jgi:uncharacterized protein involved in outer membrane biogenesis
MTTGRVRPWHYLLGALLVAVVLLVALWRWDWFIPQAERIASARLGRTVHIGHVHLHLARDPVLEVDGLVIDNPPDFAGPGPFASIARIRVTVDALAYLRSRALVVPTIAIDRPEVNAIALADGRNNWTLTSGGAAPSGRPGAGPRIGDLRITAGRVHAIDPQVKADFRMDLATREAAEGHPAQIVVQAHGTYNGQPITGQFIGGAVLTLRGTGGPYPVDLSLVNGATRVAVRGTVQDPLAFAGADLKIEVAGQSLGALTPLTGLPAPATPPYHLTADATYTPEKRLRLDHIDGRLGRSDIHGSISVNPASAPPQVDADLGSKQIDLADFAGLIGGEPGHVETRGQSPAQQQRVVQAAASPYLLPHSQLDLPRLKAADVSLHYRADHIEGKFVPLDDVTADIAIKDGAIRAHPISVGVGHGRIVAELAAEPAGTHAIQARSDVDFRQVDVARVMAATHSFAGAGTIGGHAVVEGTGSSIGDILGDGNGELKLFMTGGNLSSLLVDLSGLEFGSAVLSALGLPKQTAVRCLVTDFALRKGILDTRTLLLDTEAANVTGKGNINLQNETIDYRIRTEPKHFTLGSLPAPIDITGTLKHPSVAPDARELAVRGGLAVGLGVLLTPLAALLPTIQLGLGHNNDCEAVIHEAKSTSDPAARQGEGH